VRAEVKRKMRWLVAAVNLAIDTMMEGLANGLKLMTKRANSHACAGVFLQKKSKAYVGYANIQSE
jgi:hypothetical protein